MNYSWFLTSVFFFRNLREHLSFLFPVFMDSQFKKAQVFCCSRYITDVVGKTSYQEILRFKGLTIFSFLAQIRDGEVASSFATFPDGWKVDRRQHQRWEGESDEGFQRRVSASQNKLILSKNEKLSRLCQVLVCTDVAGMGLDTQDLNLSINIGNIFYSLSIMRISQCSRYSEVILEG